MKKILTLIVAIAAFSLTAAAQTYEVPKNYVLKAKTDYEPYEPQVISTIDWLQSSPWAEDEEKRQEANGFLGAWLTGAPNISININNTVADLAKENPELLITYMGGFTKYILQHKTDPDKKKANLEAVKAVIEKYSTEKSHKKSKKIEELIKMDKEGKLQSWVDKNFN